MENNYSEVQENPERKNYIILITYLFIFILEKLYSMIIRLYEIFDLLPNNVINIFEKMEKDIRDNKKSILELSQNIYKNLAINLLIWYFSNFKYYTNFFSENEGNKTIFFYN